MNDNKFSYLFEKIIKDEKGNYIKLKMDDYSMMTTIASSLINIAREALYSIEENNNCVIDLYDVINTLDVASQLIPMTEIEVLDSINSQLDK